MRTSKEYINAIKAKYEKEKNGQYALYFNDLKRNPLKELCEDLFKNGLSSDDKNTFASFFRFSLEQNEKIQLKTIEDFNLNRFRNVTYFLTTDVKNPSSKVCELVAILVNYNPRPYAKFRDFEEPLPPLDKPKEIKPDTKEIPEVAPDSEDNASANNDPIDPSTGITPELTTDIVDQDKREEETPTETETKEVIDNPENKPPDSEYDDTKPMGFLTYPPATTVRKIPPRPNKMYIIIGSILVMVILVWGLNKTVFTPKNCMIWMEDHYEKIDCSDPEIQVYRIPLNDKLLEKFRKVAYSDTLTFFDPYGKPLIWYSKLNGQYELFTYHGLHPVTEKTLKPITHTIVNNITNNPNR
ncbi:hypothetical protein [Flavobacterium cerinum]|uniref:Uncharacterized protein n=1 Tax=Flavobacterium cerinum TaxID=2502784 RepID=A0ABY5ILY4_9FLAO|nr:hypothetical protein [Flavobacterium cerinum]UUC43853.1 hypothetical protein NOX80_09430 [Flavobacterium cerinum]